MTFLFCLKHVGAASLVSNKPNILSLTRTASDTSGASRLRAALAITRVGSAGPCRSDLSSGGARSAPRHHPFWSHSHWLIRRPLLPSSPSSPHPQHMPVTAGPPPSGSHGNPTAGIVPGARMKSKLLGDSENKHWVPGMIVPHGQSLDCHISGRSPAQPGKHWDPGMCLFLSLFAFAPVVPKARGLPGRARREPRAAGQWVGLLRAVEPPGFPGGWERLTPSCFWEGPVSGNWVYSVVLSSQEQNQGVCVCRHKTPMWD